MKKEFVPYEESLALKELGYDEPCIAHFRKPENVLIFLGHGLAGVRYSWVEDEGEVLSPIYQQVFRWFRDKGYGIEVYSKSSENKEWYFLFKKGTITTGDIIYSNQEEAELACLKSLIETEQIRNGTYQKKIA